MSSLTPRERLLSALCHEEPDRVPIVIGANNATGMKMGAYRKLKEYLGENKNDRYLYDWPELGTTFLDETVLRRLHSDVRGVWDRFPDKIYKQNVNRPQHSPYIDDWGSGQTEIAPGVFMPGVHPLSEAKTVGEAIWLLQSIQL